jgi:four helix bundle protein
MEQEGMPLLLLLKLLLIFFFFMFDFEKLEVYSKAKSFNLRLQKYIQHIHLDAVIKTQLRRASLSIVLNIAEGSGRRTKPDKRNFLVIARGSTFECVAIFDLLKDGACMKTEDYEGFYAQCEELSKMLYAMIQKMES